MPQSMSAAPWRGDVRPLIGPMRLTLAERLPRLGRRAQQREARESVGALEQGELGERRREAVAEHVRAGRAVVEHGEEVVEEQPLVVAGARRVEVPRAGGPRLVLPGEVVGLDPVARPPRTAASSARSPPSSRSRRARARRAGRRPDRARPGRGRPLGAAKLVRSVPGGNAPPVEVGDRLVEQARRRRAASVDADASSGDVPRRRNEPSTPPNATTTTRYRGAATARPRTRWRRVDAAADPPAPGSPTANTGRPSSRADVGLDAWQPWR